MTDSLILKVAALAMIGRQGGWISREEAAERLGLDDPPEFAFERLRLAWEQRSSLAADEAMCLGWLFGIDDRWKPYLTGLVAVDWHRTHEEFISMLVELGGEDTLPALYFATQIQPPGMEWDEARPWATKAVWGIGAIPGEVSERALTALAAGPDELVSENAKYQLKLRASGQRWATH